MRGGVKGCLVLFRKFISLGVSTRPLYPHQVLFGEVQVKTIHCVQVPTKSGTPVTLAGGQMVHRWATHGCLLLRLSEFCVHEHDFKACGKMVHRWATHSCQLTIHKTYHRFSTFCMKLAKPHLLKSGRASGQMATHGRLLTIYFVCRFLLLYLKTKLIVDSKKILKSAWALGRWSNVAQVGNTWSATDHLWT